MAFSSNTRWNIQADGDDTNGGSFGGAGTDRSLQPAAQLVIDNSTVVATVAGSVITFASGYVPSAADNGNCVNLISSTGGTPPTMGRYQIQAQSATTWTLDRTTGATGATLTLAKMGGALASLVPAQTYYSSANQRIFLKYSATPYTITSAITLMNNNGDYQGNSFEGYYATQGDAPTGNNRPTIKVNAAVNGFTMPSAPWSLSHFILDGNGTTRGLIGILFSGTAFALNVKVTGFAQEGIKNGRAYHCEVTGCGVTGGAAATTATTLYYSWIHNNAKSGGSGSNFTCCAITNNTGDGAVYGTGAWAQVVGCLIYGNTGSGVNTMNNYMPTTGHFINNIFAKNGGYGLGSWNFSSPWYICSGNVFWSNSSGVGTWTGTFMTGPNVIIAGTDPTNDPFVDKANGDFRLNNIAGAGALAKGMAFPNWINLGLGVAGAADPGPFPHPDLGVAAGAVQLFNGGKLA